MSAETRFVPEPTTARSSTIRVVQLLMIPGSIALLYVVSLWSLIPYEWADFGGDLIAYRSAAERLAATGTPYHPIFLSGSVPNDVENVQVSYYYTPLLAQLFTLLRGAPHLPVAALWSATQALCLAALLPIVYRRYGGRVTVEGLILVFAGAAAVYPLQLALFGGNVSGWLAVAVAVVLLGSPRQIGVVSALVAIIKVLPLPLLAISVVAPGSRFHAVAAVVVIVGLAVALAPAAWIDWIHVLPNIATLGMADSVANLSPAAVGAEFGQATVGAAVGLGIAGSSGVAALMLARSGQTATWPNAVAAATTSITFASVTLWDHYAAPVVPLVVASWPRLGRVGRSVVLVAVTWQLIAWASADTALVRLGSMLVLLATCVCLIWPGRAFITGSDDRASVTEQPASWASLPFRTRRRPL